MEFHHQNSSIDTLTMSVADLRDLLQAFSLSEDDRLAEINLILKHIEYKSKLPAGTLKVKKESPPSAPAPKCSTGFS